LHSLRLLPYYPALKAHLDTLEAMPLSFTKPPHLGSLQEGQEALEDACELKFGGWINKLAPVHAEWEGDWQTKIRFGYEKLSQTLWRVAREFDVRGWIILLRNPPFGEKGEGFSTLLRNPECVAGGGSVLP
jgi:hypothetical protein